MILKGCVSHTLPYSTPRLLSSKCQEYSDGFGQNRGNRHCKYDSKTCLLKEASDYCRLTNTSKEQKKQKMRDEKGVAESSIIGFDYRRVAMTTKTMRTRAMRIEKKMITEARDIPKDFSNDRNISTFRRQWFLFLFG